MIDFIKKNTFIGSIFLITLTFGFVTFLTFIDKSFLKLTDINLQFLLIANIILLLFLFFARLKTAISSEEFWHEVFQIFLIHITFILFPIVISFVLYFTFLHSLKVLKQEYNYLKSLISDLDLLKFFILLIPHTIIAFVFLIIFMVLINIGIIKISLFLFFIIAISAITLPHAIIMSNFYSKKY